MRTPILALVLCVLLPGFVSAQNREHLQMNADLRIIQEQVNKLQLTSNQLADQVRQVNKRLDDQAAANQKTFADLQLLISTLTTTVNTVREKLDDNTVRVQELMQELPAMRSGLSMVAEQLNTLVGLLQPAVNPDGPDGAAGANARPGGVGGVVLLESPKTLFDAAMRDYTSNRPEIAVDGFQEFLDKFPDAPQAPQAQFYIGESYRVQRKFKESVQAYQKVIDTYKGSDQVPEAYYQQGLSYIEMGQQTRATAVFNIIIKQFPDSNSFILAKQKLSKPTGR